MQNSKMPQSCANCCNFRFGFDEHRSANQKYSSWCTILKQGVSPYGIPCMAFIQKRSEEK